MKARFHLSVQLRIKPCSTGLPRNSGAPFILSSPSEPLGAPLALAVVEDLLFQKNIRRAQTTREGLILLSDFILVHDRFHLLNKLRVFGGNIAGF